MYLIRIIKIFHALHVSVEWLKGETDEYELFFDSFKFGCTNYKNDKQNKDIAKAIGIDSVKEYNEIMFLRDLSALFSHHKK